MRLPARAGGRVALFAALLALAACGSQSKPARRGGLVPIGAGLGGPAGLKASVYASGLRNLSALALDSRGRLWSPPRRPTTTRTTASGSSPRRAPARST